MKKLTTAIIFTLTIFLATSAYAWPETDHMNMCGSAAKVIRDYKGNPKAWQNRDLYTESRKAQLYFQANCPETKAGKVENAHTNKAKLTHQAPKARLATCKDCYNAGYRKGVIDGKATTHTQRPQVSVKPATYHKPQMIQHGNHTHHSAVEKADCELTDALNRRTGPVVSFIKNSAITTAFSRAPAIKHGNHSHHTAVEKADCELTDALNRQAGPIVVRVK